MIPILNQIRYQGSVLLWLLFLFVLVLLATLLFAFLHHVGGQFGRRCLSVTPDWQFLLCPQGPATNTIIDKLLCLFAATYSSRSMSRALWGSSSAPLSSSWPSDRLAPSGISPMSVLTTCNGVASSSSSSLESNHLSLIIQSIFQYFLQFNLCSSWTFSFSWRLFS